MMEYTLEEFEISFKKIYNMFVRDNIPQKKRCVVFLGGQPGIGKTSFVEQDDLFAKYIKINDDEYRKYHPNTREITTVEMLQTQRKRRGR